jgi:hypothetical protein
MRYGSLESAYLYCLFYGRLIRRCLRANPLRRFGKSGGGSAVQLLGRNVLGVAENGPQLAERIFKLAVASAPKLVGQRHGYLAAGRESTIKKRIHIFRTDVQDYAAAAFV